MAALCLSPSVTQCGEYGYDKLIGVIGTQERHGTEGTEGRVSDCINKNGCVMTLDVT